MSTPEHRSHEAIHWAEATVDRALADALRPALDAALDPDASDEVRGRPLAILTRYKGEGGRMGDAYETLASLQDEDEPARGDLIDDLLDGVSGWCSPDDWLWRDVVYPHEVRCSDALTGEIHARIVRWSKERGLEWCRIRIGYAFACEADVEVFRARWAEVIE